MPGPDIEHLHLEDALEDSPQTRHLLTVFESDAMLLKKFSQKMHNCCQRIMTAQNELCAATQSLAQHLRSYETIKFPLEAEDSVLTSTLQQFSSYLDDISSVQQILAQQYSETMMYPLNKFLQADIEEITNMFEMFKMATNDHDQSLVKYMKLPMKKEDKSRTDISEELYQNRQKFHQLLSIFQYLPSETDVKLEGPTGVNSIVFVLKYCKAPDWLHVPSYMLNVHCPPGNMTALHYYSSLNALQYKRKCFLLEPVMGFLHAQRSLFQTGQDIILRSDLEDFLGNIGSSVQSVHADLAKETQKTVELIDSIEQQSQHQYHAEPPPDMPFIPPNTNLTQKAGYLFCRGKQVLLSSKWERMYFFTQGGNLMSQTKDEVSKKNFNFAGSLVLDLNEDPDIVVDSCMADDRRHTFQITAPHSKKTFILQAENYRDRDEWIATLNNIIKDGGYVRGKSPSTLSDSSKKKEQSRPYSKSQSTENASVSSDQSPVKPSSSVNSLSSVASSSGAGDLVLDTPIQFDLVSPSEENRAITSPLSGPPKRLNPFDQSAAKVLNPAFDNAAFSETFTIRFLGSMEVKGDRGEQLVHSTIRQIMAARAIHNIFKMTESLMVVTSEGMRLIDSSNNVVRVEFALQDISFWSVHPDNNRLFGFVTRTRVASPTEEKDKNPNPSFACHVFESNSSAETICQAISTSTQIAFQALMEKRKAVAAAKQGGQAPAQSKEKALLLENIQKFKETNDEAEIHDDADDNLPLSPDGKFLILNVGDESDSVTTAAVTTSGGAAAAASANQATAKDPELEENGESEA